MEFQEFLCLFFKSLSSTSPHNKSTKIDHKILSPPVYDHTLPNQGHSTRQPFPPPTGHHTRMEKGTPLQFKTSKRSLSIASESVPPFHHGPSNHITDLTMGFVELPKWSNCFRIGSSNANLWRCWWKTYILFLDLGSLSLQLVSNSYMQIILSFNFSSEKLHWLFVRSPSDHRNAFLADNSVCWFLPPVGPRQTNLLPVLPQQRDASQNMRRCLDRLLKCWDRGK